MNVYLELSEQSRGLQRVYDALIRYLPASVTAVKRLEDAELVIFHVNGRNDHLSRIVDKVTSQHKKYAIIQYCLRSTMRPSTADWIDLWEGAKLVWSYYDLPALCSEDGLQMTGRWFPFYYAPLGVEAGVFYERRGSLNHKYYVIATNSTHALQQSVKECVVAAKRCNRRVFHLGHELRRGDDITCMTGISDNELGWFYSQCEFVSGLRRVEGFELPAVEGLLCGARPILFDKPHYRKWYQGLAVFIAEKDRQTTTDLLESVFRFGALPVKEEEKAEARRRFNWEKILGGFWERILA